MEREPLIYHLDSTSHQSEDYRDLPDEFFEVTVDDVRKRFAQLKSERWGRRKWLSDWVQYLVQIPCCCRNTSGSDVFLRCLEQIISQFGIRSCGVLSMYNP